MQAESALPLKSLQVQYSSRNLGSSSVSGALCRNFSYRFSSFLCSIAYATENTRSFMLPSHRAARIRVFSDRSAIINALRTGS